MKMVKMMLCGILLVWSAISMTGCHNEKNTALPYVNKSVNYLGLKDIDGNAITSIKARKK